MVTSNLLQLMFAQQEISKMLEYQNERNKGGTQQLNQDIVGNFHSAIKVIPFLEGVSSTLPRYSNPIDQFRRVISTRLAAVASFFGFACYDMESIKMAYALLQKSTYVGDDLKVKYVVFPGGTKRLVCLSQLGKKKEITCLTHTEWMMGRCLSQIW